MASDDMHQQPRSDLWTTKKPACSLRRTPAILNGRIFFAADPASRVQWLIIQGRFDGKALLPSLPVTVAVLLAEEQQPQPAG